MKTKFLSLMFTLSLFCSNISFSLSEDIQRIEQSEENNEQQGYVFEQNSLAKYTAGLITSGLLFVADRYTLLPMHDKLHKWVKIEKCSFTSWICLARVSSVIVLVFIGATKSADYFGKKFGKWVVQPLSQEALEEAKKTSKQ